VITKELADLIVQTANREGLDPLLVLEVMRQESAFRPRARSGKNAGGLMQLIPSTAARFGVSDPMDPYQAISGGCKYLRYLWERFEGRVPLVLAGYNAGEGSVEQYGRMVPPYPETINYVQTIMARYRQALVTRQRVEQALAHGRGARAHGRTQQQQRAPRTSGRVAQPADVERLNRIGRMGRPN
jgi:soluble lytic murein transglycosylase